MDCPKVRTTSARGNKTREGTGISAPRNSVKKNGRKSCRGAKESNEIDRGKRERRTPLLKSAAANGMGDAIRLSLIKYRGSAQNTSVVYWIFLRRDPLRAAAIEATR